MYDLDAWSISQLVKRSAVESLLEYIAGAVTPEFQDGDTLLGRLLAEADDKLTSNVEGDLMDLTEYRVWNLAFSEKIKEIRLIISR